MTQPDVLSIFSKDRTTRESVESGGGFFSADSNDSDGAERAASPGDGEGQGGAAEGGEVSGDMRVLMERMGVVTAAPIDIPYNTDGSRHWRR